MTTTTLTVNTLSKSEKSYVQSSLLCSPPARADARSLLDFRSIALETGVAPLSNGSAKLALGHGTASTQVLAAVKLEVEDIDAGEGNEHGRIVVNVSCSPSAYPNLTQNALDEHQQDLSSTLHATLSHPSLRPRNLSIIDTKGSGNSKIVKGKAWAVYLDLLVLADAGNVWDASFMAARAALWDTKVPRTRGVVYRARNKGEKEKSDMDVDDENAGQSGFDTRTAVDFDLPDYWDEGEVLDGREAWPVGITLNIVPPVHFLDATTYEESAVPLRLLYVASFPEEDKSALVVQALRLIGLGEIEPANLKSLIKEAEGYAKTLFMALEGKLREEEVRRGRKARDRFLQMR